jgi:transcription elongation GreA/GreB family factor
MTKSTLISWITSHLEQELSEAKAALGGQAHDTTAQRIRELESALLMYRFLPVRDPEPDAVVAPASLIQVDYSGKKTWALIVPHHGGLVTEMDGHLVQVLTPQSPLGEAALGKKSGQEVAVQLSSGIRHYRILQVL